MKQKLNEVQRLQKIAGILKEGMDELKSSKESFLSKMEKLNPGYSKESVLSHVKDEYDPENEYDTEDHEEYMKEAEEWFDKMAANGPTVKVGDEVEVVTRSNSKVMTGTITKDTILKGSFLFNGNIEPDRIPAWEIKTKFGTLYYPQHDENEYFTKS
jgi:hypothetical protein